MSIYCLEENFISETDKRAPTISNCPTSDMISEIAGSSITVSWIEPTAVDDAGNATLLVKTHSPGEVFEVGSTTVLYMFVDSSNNIASCTFAVKVRHGVYALQKFTCV